MTMEKNKTTFKMEKSSIKNLLCHALGHVSAHRVRWMCTCHRLSYSLRSGPLITFQMWTWRSTWLVKYSLDGTLASLRSVTTPMPHPIHVLTLRKVCRGLMPCCCGHPKFIKMYLRPVGCESHNWQHLVRGWLKRPTVLLKISWAISCESRAINPKPRGSQSSFLTLLQQHASTTWVFGLGVWNGAWCWNPSHSGVLAQNNKTFSLPKRL